MARLNELDRHLEPSAVEPDGTEEEMKLTLDLRNAPGPGTANPREKGSDPYCCGDKCIPPGFGIRHRTLTARQRPSSHARPPVGIGSHRGAPCDAGHRRRTLLKDLQTMSRDYAP
ncbi:hypothetical protein NDU88_008407 [Pleurodeles waltl]|uniref:Uncharacterized protein n=1 Tax=Pleurodeles waltl TaxID=8319 RepID=A0AAV7RUN1_PLEWA|nr:hypothetical protein NDU88_008407 [Pleurodeles waltl]